MLWDAIEANSNIAAENAPRPQVRCGSALTLASQGSHEDNQSYCIGSSVAANGTFHAQWDANELPLHIFAHLHVLCAGNSIDRFF